MPDRVEVHHESPVKAGLVIVPSRAGGEDGRLCVRDRVHVEVEVHLCGDRTVWPGWRAAVGDGLAGERERARLTFWRQDVDPVRIPVVVYPPAQHRRVELGELARVSPPWQNLGLTCHAVSLYR